MGKEIKYLQRFRAKEELKLSILKTIANFESKEEPGVKLSDNDIINILSSIIKRRTD